MPRPGGKKSYSKVSFRTVKVQILSDMSRKIGQDTFEGKESRVVVIKAFFFFWDCLQYTLAARDRCSSRVIITVIIHHIIHSLSVVLLRNNESEPLLYNLLHLHVSHPPPPR